MPVFTARVPGVLKAGDKILIAGKIKDEARKFSVNLSAEACDEPRDVVLHFDVRFHRDNIISLSRKNGTWVGSGSYDTNCNLFVRGTFFRIVFEVKDSSVITIYCQNKFHSNFLPKIPLSAARYVVVWADVERVTQLDFYMGQGAADASTLPRNSAQGMQGMASPPNGATHVEANCTVRNRPAVVGCANEYPRREASSSDEESEHDGTDTTLTARPDFRSDQVDSYDTSSNCSRTLLKTKPSLYSKARAPFQQMCNMVIKSRRKRGQPA